MGRGRRSGMAWAAALMLAACSAPTSGSSPNAGGVDAPAPTAVAGTGPTVLPPFGPAVGAASAQPGIPALPTEPVVFLPPGPASPADPPVGASYESISRLACSDAASLAPGTGNEPLWTAVGAACTALATGSPAQWARAEALVSALAPVPAARCLEAAAVAGAERVLDFHAANPGVPVRLASGTGEACPRRLTGATVLDDSGAPAGPSSVRVSGPVTGGTVLRLDGFTGAVSGVLVNGLPDAGNAIGVNGANSFDPVTLVMPPASAPGTVRLSLSGPLPIAGWVDFTYTAGGSGSPTASPSSQRTTPATSPSAAASPSRAPSPPDPGPPPATAPTGGGP